MTCTLVRVLDPVAALLLSQWLAPTEEESRHCMLLPLSHLYLCQPMLQPPRSHRHMPGILTDLLSKATSNPYNCVRKSLGSSLGISQGTCLAGLRCEDGHGGLEPKWLERAG